MTIGWMALFCLCLLGIAPPATGNECASPKASSQWCWRVLLPEFRCRLSPGCSYRQWNAKTVEISSGQVLVEAHRDGAIVTPMAMVYLKHGSIAWFRISSGIEQCFSLWDKSNSSMAVIARGHAAVLLPGQELVITDHWPHAGEILLSDNSPRHSRNTAPVGNGYFMTTTEFSLCQALSSMRLLSSKDHLDRLLGGKILKMANLLDMFSGDRGGYGWKVKAITSLYPE